jgi:hypothetical protein
LIVKHKSSFDEQVEVFSALITLHDEQEERKRFLQRMRDLAELQRKAEEECRMPSKNIIRPADAWLTKVCACVGEAMCWTVEGSDGKITFSELEFQRLLPAICHVLPPDSEHLKNLDMEKLLEIARTVHSQDEPVPVPAAALL